MDYKNYNLNGNPFRLTPPINPNEIVWAGMNDVKEQLEKRVKISMRTSTSRIVINWGDYGSGKTHAATYFTRTNRLSEIAKELHVAKARSIKVNLPRTSKDVVQAFWRTLLGQLSFRSIVEDIQNLREKLQPTEGFESVISALANDNVVEQLFVQLSELDLDDAESLEDYERYLYGDSTKTTLKKLDLPLGLTDDEQVVNLISTLFNCLSYQKGIYSAIILWIDEFEDIDTLNKSGADRFTTFLRQLIDKTPNNLTLFLNFTPKRFLNIEDLSVYMGEALLSRAGVRISFEEPSIEEAINYVDELLNLEHHRIDSTSSSNRYHPFSNDVIEHVLQNIGRRSIRKINEAFSIILELALIEEKSPEIDIAFVDSISDEIIAWEN